MDGAVGAVAVIAFDHGVEAITLSSEKRVSGALMFPESSQNAGKIWCIDDGLRSFDEGSPYSYVGHLLGSCPGTPTNDTIYSCTDFNTDLCDPNGAPEVQPIGGTLGGKAIASSPTVNLGGGLGKVQSMTGYGLALFMTETTPGSGTAVGLIVGLEGGPHAGDVYCIDSGTWKGNAMEETFASSKVSYVGNCNAAPATDKLEGCVGY